MSTPFGVICYNAQKGVIIIYTRLRDLREDNDLTQVQASKIGFISKNSYIRYENGERVPPFDVMLQYANYYNVSLDYLAGRTNNKKGGIK